jgi:hypothetical protein
MPPMQVLQCVRRGFALATPRTVELVRGCVDIDVVDDHWVPRWALDAATSLENLGYSPGQINGLFVEGRERVLAELTTLAQAGLLPRPVQPRKTWGRDAIDQPTEAALKAALANHRGSCVLCLERLRCLDGSLLEEEMQALFPEDRRKQPRS